MQLNKIFNKTITLSIIAFFGLLLFAAPAFAQQQLTQPQEEKLEAIITQVKQEKQIKDQGKKHLYQNLELFVTKGVLKDKKIIVENGKIPLSNIPKYKVGDRVIVTISKGPDKKNVFYITDYVRRISLYWLFAFFLTVVLVIGGLRGFTSILGLGFSFLVIFAFVLPQISAGRDPVGVAIIASMVIVPVSFFLSHGINKKTISAVIGTAIALIITGVLANFFVNTVNLSGFASEESSFVEAAKPGIINMQGLLLAGIIIGALGILDDITISQAAVVSQLHKLNPKLDYYELFMKAMDVGRDHIASMVNTLVLVYTGAAMPLLLLFINNPISPTDVINYEVIAEEIVRTLVASIGLILAVPITTLITVFILKRK